MRLYGDQIYGLSSLFLNKYISPQIQKESFISMFKNGLVKYENINSKEEISIHPSTKISNLLLNLLEINVPDEKGNLIINIKSLKSDIYLSEINEDNLEEIMINERKKLKEQFIKDMFYKITKKEQSNSFMDGFIENMITKIINGLKININDIDLLVKFKNSEFKININNLFLSIENNELNIDIKNFSVFFKNDINIKEMDLITKLNINIKLTIKENSDNNESFCDLKLNFNDLIFNLDINALKSLADVINLFRGIKHEKIFLRYKKLIYFNRPKLENNKKNYKLLWLYAINTVIKLRKFVCFDSLGVFELLNSTQKKIIENEENNSKYLLPNDLNILICTKKILEKKIIDSKESLTNKFFSFFSSKSEEPKTLTNEEKEMIEEIYKENNLRNYLIKGKCENNNEKDIFKKINKYLNNFEINFNIDILKIFFKNKYLDDKDENLNTINNIYLNKFYIDIKYDSNNFCFKMNIYDIGKNEKESLCKEIKTEEKVNINEEKNLVEILYDKNTANFIIGKDIEISEDILFLLINYNYYIIQNINNYNHKSFFNKSKNEKDFLKYFSKEKINFNIPYLPSLSLITHNNKININISDYIWTNELISFKIKLNDLHNILIDNYQLNIERDRENNRYNINLEKSLNIKINNQIIENLLCNFKNINNSIIKENNLDDNQLFKFNFTKNINNLNIKEFFNIKINLKIEELILILKDNESQSSIKLLNFNFNNEDNHFLLNANEIFLEYDLLSLKKIIQNFKEINLNIKTKEFKYKYNYMNIFIDLIKLIQIDINHMNGYLFINHKSYYIDLIAEGIKGSKDLTNNQIINFNFDKLNMNWIYTPNTIKMIDSKNINYILRINDNFQFVVKLNMDSPIVSFILLVYNFQFIKNLLKYFLNMKTIYEIQLNNLKSEIFESYLKNPEDKSDFSLYITNYNKKQENNQIDIIHLEKFGFNYNVDSYKDIIVKINGKNLRFFGSQRDFSFLFFSLLRPEEKKDNNNKENFGERFKSMNLEFNLSQIKIDFYLENYYDKVYFDFNLGDLSMNLNASNKDLKYFKLGLNDILINFYEDNKNKIALLSILNYEAINAIIPNKTNNNQNILTNSKKQIEIEKDSNKLNININKFNILFKYNIIISIFYYFNDISVFDLMRNYYKQKNLDVSNKNENNIDIQIIFSEILFQFPNYIFYKDIIFYLYFNQLDIAYIKIINDSIKDHRLRISLSNIILNNNRRRNIISSRDEEEFLLLVLNIKENKSLSILFNSLFNILIINFSYKDIISLYSIILDINKLYQNIIQKKNKNILINENKIKESFINSNNYYINENENKYTQNIEEKNKLNKSIFSNIQSMICNINIESINVVLLEEEDTNNLYDIYSCYKPFLNCNIFKIKINSDYNQNKEKKYQYIKLDSIFNLVLNNYNDNIQRWEPITEDLIINLDYILKTEKNKLIDDYTLKINKLILNISDTFIITLLIKLNNWIFQFNRLYKYLKRFKQLKNETKLPKKTLHEKIILKYIINNCTDLDSIIKYKNKEYSLQSSKILCLEYDNKDIVETEHSLSNLIILEFKDKRDNNKISIFPDNFGIKQYTININNIERYIFIKAKLIKEKFVCIYIFNSITIKNNSNYALKMNLKGNDNNIESKIINLNPNSRVGLPINYIQNEDTKIIFELQKDNTISLSEPINLKDFIKNDLKEKITQDLFFSNNQIFLSLISKNKSEQYTNITISYKYCILNCLPCSIFISKIDKNENKQNILDDTIEIAKNSLYKIDDLTLLTGHKSIYLILKLYDKYFYSKLSLRRNETKKVIKFTDKEQKDSLILPILIKETDKIKAIIIYSEYMLLNKSGIEINFSSQDENNHNNIFQVEKNLYLISSEIEKSNSYLYLKSFKNIFIKDYVQFEQIKNNPSFEFSLKLDDKNLYNQYNFDLIICQNLSNLCCNNDINFINKISENLDLITIYSILPKYNIINLASNNQTQNINLLLKKENKYYMYINIKNLEEIREKRNYYKFDNLSLDTLYTIFIENNLYNVEVKKADNGGYKNIYILNNNLKNSQVLVENKTNFNIILKQKKYEKFKQVIKMNEIQILKIYEQTNQNFSAQIDNKLYFINLDEKGKKQILGNLFLNIIKNKNTKKIVFYIQKINESEDDTPKSKSLMNLPKISFNSLKINLNPDRYIKINILLNHISISILKQNLKENERKEIALIFLYDLKSGIILSKAKKNLFNNYDRLYQIKLNIKILSCSIYNLLFNNISYLCKNTSSPLLNIYSEFDYNYDKNKIHILQLINELGDIKLRITPIFLKEMYNLINNIIFNWKVNKQIKTDKINCDNLNINDYEYIINSNHPLSIIINKINISGVKIRYNLTKEGLDSLPKLIKEFIEYLKCFPFFAFDKETKAISEEISLEGPFKDLKVLINNLKLAIIAQLSKQIVIKSLHPSTNEIKDNINNMIGYENKINNDNDKNYLRAKYKRVFFGKNKYYKNYNKEKEILIQKYKDDIKKYENRYIIDIIYIKDSILILFDDVLFWGNNIGIKKNILYSKITKIKQESNTIIIFYKDPSDEELIIEASDKFILEQIYNILFNVSNY